MPANVRVDGLNTVLRAIRGFGPEANAELREASQRIADQVMAPAFRRRAAAVPSWGHVLSDGIKVRRDRIPAVNIGYARKAFAHGASTAMLRYATDTGTRRGPSPAPFTATSWMTAAAREYKDDAMNEWGDALIKLVRQWNRGW
jgi:hypothetical protein